MNFFQRQRDAHGMSRRLVMLSTAAVLAVVVAVDLVVVLGLGLFEQPAALILAVVAWVSGLAVAGIALTSFVRNRLLLAGGGGRVAQRLGGRHVGPDTTDPLRRRLRTVVEETAVAAGVPVPQVYVLPDQPGVNAFAAGFSPADAAVAVTQGALERLDGDELRGMVARELDHVVNGDMRLNTRLIGTLSGVLGLAIAGRLLTERGRVPVAAAGHATAVFGHVCVLLGRVIKARMARVVSRPSAGPAGGSRTSGGQDSTPREGRAEDVNQMSPSPSRPPATLGEDDALGGTPPDTGLDTLPDTAPDTGLDTLPDPAARVPVTPADVVAAVGTVAPPLRPVLRHVPEPLLDRARHPETAPRLVFGLLLAADRHARTNQHTVLATRYGRVFADAAAADADDLADLHPALRLPLAEVAFPALRRHPRAARKRALATLHRLARVDGRLDLFEYCLTRLLHQELSESVRRATRRPPRPPREVANRAMATLLAVLAEACAADKRAAGLAYRTGLAHVVPGEPIPYDPPAAGAALDGLWSVLAGVDGPDRELLIGGLVIVIGQDGEMSVAEVELLRTVCALLHCPLPPLARTRPEQVAP